MLSVFLLIIIIKIMINFNTLEYNNENIIIL